MWMGSLSDHVPGVGADRPAARFPDPTAPSLLAQVARPFRHGAIATVAYFMLQAFHHADPVLAATQLCRLPPARELPGRGPFPGQLTRYGDRLVFDRTDRRPGTSQRSRHRLPVDVTG